MVARTPRARTSQKRTPDRRAAIKAAGAELFATRGYRATGVREIAELAGCNQALIAYHFGDKGRLYDEILGDAVTAARRMAQEADMGASRHPERELVRVLAHAIGADRHLAPMLLREQLDPERLLNPETGQTLRSFMALTEAVLEMLPLDAEARAWDPQIVHLAIVGPLIHFIVARSFREAMAGKMDRPTSTPDFEEFVETLASLLSRGLRGPLADQAPGED